MGPNDLKGKLVAVLGFGQEGKATAKYLIQHGINPVLFDQKPWDEWPEEEKQHIKSLGLNFIFGPQAFLELKGFDVAFRSPGIRLHDIQSLEIHNLALISQTKYFFENCPAKIIGITGTKGKGTTAALIYEILSASAQKKLTAKQSETAQNVYLTGNIGKVQPLDILDNLKSDDLVVYELSSFQLQDLDKSPHIAVVLMVTSEHLDYHKNLAEYHEAKSAITRYQNHNDWAVVNSDYPASKEIGSLGKGKKIYFSGQDFSLLSHEKIQLRGKHNLENIQAAVKVSEIFNVDPEITKKVVSEFKGLEHRLEFVGQRHGIKFYDDSFSTTPETAIAAINSFSEPLVLVLGGSGKHSDFSLLGQAISNAKNIRALILVGEESQRIKSAISSFRGDGASPLMLEGAQNMREIFEKIKQSAHIGDAVVLSPACASFGMFNNYKDRGDQFKKYALSFE